MNTLATLKNKLLHDRVFHDVFNYFFDLNDDDIIGKLPGHHGLTLENNAAYRGMLKALCHGIGGVLQQDVKVEDGYFFAVPAEHFIHGGLLFRASPVPVFYFTDIELGMYAIISGGLTHVYKFSLVKEGGGFTLH